MGCLFKYNTVKDLLAIFLFTGAVGVDCWLPLLVPLCILLPLGTISTLSPTPSTLVAQRSGPVTPLLFLLLLPLLAPLLFLLLLPLLAPLLFLLPVTLLFLLPTALLFLLPATLLFLLPATLLFLFPATLLLLPPSPLLFLPPTPLLFLLPVTLLFLPTPIFLPTPLLFLLLLSLLLFVFLPPPCIRGFFDTQLHVMSLNILPRERHACVVMGVVARVSVCRGCRWNITLEQV